MLKMMVVLRLTAIVAIGAFVAVAAQTTCNTTVMNECIETLTSDVQSNISNVLDSSNLNELCSFVSTESSCLMTAGCTNSTVDGGETSAGKIDSYLYMCNDGRQAFLAASPCLNSTSVTNLTQNCYNNIIVKQLPAKGQNMNYTVYCTAQNMYLDCVQSAVQLRCGASAANFFVTYSIRQIQPIFIQANYSCTLSPSTTSTNADTESGSAIYHATICLLVAAFMTSVHLKAN